LGELLYEGEIHFTKTVEYGASIEAISSGDSGIPPEGARFDQTFHGTLQGPRLRGTISGTDYLYIRPDGRFQLHIHAQITTDDDVNIAFLSEGISIQQEGKGEAQLRSAVTLFTSSEQYAWLNKVQAWAIGTIDVEKGRATVMAYEA
jgi:hypothetical protein